MALEPSPELRERCFIPAPLVVGTREPDGRADMAPKHMVTPLSWEGHFGFDLSPGRYTLVDRSYAFLVYEGMSR